MSLRTFKEHLIKEAAAKAVTVNFGRFNPPTIGHEKLLDVSMKKVLVTIGYMQPNHKMLKRIH